MLAQNERFHGLFVAHRPRPSRSGCRCGQGLSSLGKARQQPRCAFFGDHRCRRISASSSTGCGRPASSSTCISRSTSATSRRWSTRPKTALYFHKVIGYDMPVVSGIIRTRERAIMSLGCETYREIEDKLQHGDQPPDPAEIREDLAHARGGAARRRRRPLQAADPDVVDLRRRPDDHGRRRDRARSGARHQQRHLPLHREGEEPHRHRHRHAQQHAAVCAARVRAQGAAADLDLDRHASDRDHRLRLSRAARRRRDGDRGRHPRRAGRARALPDHRPALHRRRRDRAGGGDPADRLDLAGRPLRRVHAADGRAALEPAGAHQGDLDAQGRDLLQPAHALGEHLARRAHALRGDPPGAARPPACRSRTSTSRSAAAPSGMP